MRRCWETLISKHRHSRGRGIIWITYVKNANLTTSIITDLSCFIPTRLHYHKAISKELVVTYKRQNRKAKDQCKFPFSNLLGLIIQLGCYYIVANSPEPLKSWLIAYIQVYLNSLNSWQTTCSSQYRYLRLNRVYSSAKILPCALLRPVLPVRRTFQALIT